LIFKVIYPALHIVNT